jgi:hypothetical protein
LSRHTVLATADHFPHFVGFSTGFGFPPGLAPRATRDFIGFLPIMKSF